MKYRGTQVQSYLYESFESQQVAQTGHAQCRNTQMGLGTLEVLIGH